MWPWEHLAFGYLLYSGYARLRRGGPPENYPAVALAAATQFPDLIDKPLAWTFDVLPTARSLGHSVFVAVPLVAVVAVIARRRGAPAVGDAVAVGYLSHLLGDVIYGVLIRTMVGEDVTVAAVSYLFWPVVRQPVRDTPGILERTARLFGEFVTFLDSPAGRVFIALELGLVLGVFVLWIADGRPGLSAHR